MFLSSIFVQTRFCHNFANSLSSRKLGRRPGRGLAYSESAARTVLVARRGYGLGRDPRRSTGTRQPQRDCMTIRTTSLKYE